MAPVIYDILLSLHDICRVDFSHVGQAENRIAHLLGKHTFGIVDFSSWIEETRYFFERVLI